jgi:hypothetical protein
MLLNQEIIHLQSGITRHLRHYLCNSGLYLERLWQAWCSKSDRRRYSYIPNNGFHGSAVDGVGETLRLYICDSYLNLP